MRTERLSRASSWVATGGDFLVVSASKPKREVAGGPDASAARTFAEAEKERHGTAVKNYRDRDSGGLHYWSNKRVMGRNGTIDREGGGGGQGFVCRFLRARRGLCEGCEG